MSVKKSRSPRRHPPLVVKGESVKLYTLPFHHQAVTSAE